MSFTEDLLRQQKLEELGSYGIDLGYHDKACLSHVDRLVHEQALDEYTNKNKKSSGYSDPSGGHSGSSSKDSDSSDSVENLFLHYL
ncbi:MAG: hypothetical protein ABTQ34_00135 [Bdellovibrionales bacterium]